ncbi:hypothetical protein OH77DRAFT_576731 [Trametes cingulata]|nr:hypothetical protein OH77DRAFT_576731 [Trametes cingulata]
MPIELNPQKVILPPHSDAAGAGARCPPSSMSPAWPGSRTCSKRPAAPSRGWEERSAMPRRGLDRRRHAIVRRQEKLRSGRFPPSRNATTPPDMATHRSSQRSPLRASDTQQSHPPAQSP